MLVKFDPKWRSRKVRAFWLTLLWSRPPADVQQTERRSGTHGPGPRTPFSSFAEVRPNVDAPLEVRFRDGVDLGSRNSLDRQSYDPP
jgi:hypothetical protein